MHIDRKVFHDDHCAKKFSSRFKMGGGLMPTGDAWKYGTTEIGDPQIHGRNVAARPISLIVDHFDQTRVMRLADGQSLVIGRDPAIEIAIDEPSLSRRHARFENVGGIVSVIDLGSTNGTKLNGAIVKTSAIAVGDEVTLGNVTVSIHALAPLNSPLREMLSSDQFVTALEDEVARARAFHRTVAVAVLKTDGKAADLAVQLKKRLRVFDRVAMFGDAAIELLLPEYSVDDVRALVGALPRTLCGVAVYPIGGTSSDELIEASREAMHRADDAQLFQVAQGTSALSHRAEILFVSPTMQAVFETAKRVATSTIPVLIRGETGVGKEVLARAIHDHGPRRNKALVTINCGAIPSNLVESVLFGHERGSFTGATASNAGVFEEGDGSTVLLDEIGELSTSAQTALLRVLETKQVRRVGANKEASVDVRIIAATHRDLEAMVKAGTFREDLFYRLNTMTLEVPPLRERPEEIGPLADRFLAAANAANGRQLKGIDVEAMKILLRYPWPGNIRELRNAIEHAVVVAVGDNILPNDLPKRVREFVSTVLSQEAPLLPAPPTPEGKDLRDGMQRFETQLIMEALRATKGNRTEAARRLKIPVRTLSHKIRHYGIKRLGVEFAEGPVSEDEV